MDDYYIDCRTMRTAYMDDYGTDYRTHLSNSAVSMWYISASAYGGLEYWDGLIVDVI